MQARHVFRLLFDILVRDGDGMLAINEFKPLLVLFKEVEKEDIEATNDEKIQTELLEYFDDFHQNSPGDISEARFLAFFEKQRGVVLEEESGRS